MSKHLTNHFEQVEQWLKDNVHEYLTPEKVTLHSFDVDWSELSGSFRVLFDNLELSDELTFSVDQSGKANFHLPMFHLGFLGPASYNAIVLTEVTKGAIQKGLRKAIPRVMGYGINRVTGKEVTSFTTLKERILNEDEFELSRNQVSSPDYSIIIEISNTYQNE